MPKRTKLPALPDDVEKALVQKTNPLLSLSATDLTLSELKILDTYLAQIDSHRPDRREVSLDKGKIEDLLGVARIKAPDLSARIDHLFRPVTILDPDKPDGFTKIALFERAQCTMDELGLWRVNLSASSAAMAYLFTPENIGYFKYRLKNVLALKSRYSYILYLYLEQNKFRKTWVISLDELKDILRCTASTYAKFYRFNDLVLKPSCAEICEKTNMQFEYAPVKRGRTVTAISFDLATKNDSYALDAAAQMSFLDQVPAQASPEMILHQAAPEFTPAEIKDIQQLLQQLPSDCLPPAPTIEIRRGVYLSALVSKMDKVSQTSHEGIKNRFAYLCAMLRKEVANSAAKPTAK